MGLFSKLSGINSLAEQYPAKDLPQGKEFLKQTIQFGAIRYRKCVNIIISQQGFYLRVNPPLGQMRKIFIPWDKIIRTSTSSLYGSKAAQLFIESPTNESLRVYNDLFIIIQPHLKTTLR